MHTQNVNVAASESSKTWVKTPESIYFSRKNAALTDLAQIEGEMIVYSALARLDIASADLDEVYAPMIAQETIEQLLAMGAIDSPVVYEMVKAVDAMIKAADPEVSPQMLPSLQEMQAEAVKIKARYMADILERLKPFSVDVWGQMEYREEFASYMTYWTEGCVHLGRAWTIAEAMEHAKRSCVDGEVNQCGEGEVYHDESGCDTGPVSFVPSRIVITDEHGKRVLTGGACDLIWDAHITEPEEIARIKEQQEKLLEQARAESGWDNHETARQLRSKAKQIGRGIVDSVWQGHREVMQALAEFTYPGPEYSGYMTEEELQECQEDEEEA